MTLARTIAVMLLVPGTLASQAAPPVDAPAIAGQAGRGFEAVGAFLQRLVGTGDTGTEEAPFNATRRVSQRFPATGETAVHLENRFGPIHVTAWDARVVDCQARVAARATATGAATALAESVRVQVQERNGRVEMRTMPPADPVPKGAVYAVRFDVRVPRDAQVTASTFLGDIEVSGLGGAVVVDCRGGAVRLRELHGPVQARTRGGHAFTAENLAGPATLLLDEADARVEGAEGPLSVSLRGGALRVGGLADMATAEISATGATVTLVLDEPRLSALEAVVQGGRLLGGPRDVVHAGDATLLPARETPPAIRADVVFGDLVIERPEPPPEETAPVSEEAGGALFTAVEEHAFACTTPCTLRITGREGQVRVRAGDTETGFRVRETRRVRAPNAARAAAVFDAMRPAAVLDNGVLVVTEPETAESADIDARVDLELVCPPETTVVIEKTGGETRATGLAGALRIAQDTGAVTVRDTGGSVHVELGDATLNLENGTGAATATQRSGTARVRAWAGTLDLAAETGTVAIEAPRGDTGVRVGRGDVRVLALDGLAGHIDVAADAGDIALLLPEDADVDLRVTALGGVVHSALPLSGTVVDDRQEFHAVRGEGRYRVRLETRRGGIQVDGARP